MDQLPNQQPDDITILDMEASIEHLTRGTVRNVDALIVISEPYYRSLETTGRLVPAAQELGIEQVWIVANKVRSSRDEAAIREYCRRRDYEIIGIVPFDECVNEADLVNRALIDHAPTSGAVVEISKLADEVVGRLNISSSE